MYSAVVGKELTCRSDSRFDVWGTKGYGLQPPQIRSKIIPSSIKYTLISTPFYLPLYINVPIFISPKIILPLRNRSCGIRL
ncbi:hypothetical protein L1887_19952 [Cichorium endivia]|nr:hypothetical protein L1887_19952 [Cichorium endivia]